METTQIVNVINLPHRIDRMMQFDKQSKEQEFEYKRWDGQIVQQIPFLGISKSHKSIIQYAKSSGMTSVTVSEDDTCFSSFGAWDYYCENEPNEYDIYFGSVYKSIIEKGKMNFGLSGLTLYTVHERFYDTFLSMKEMNHLDRELGRFAWKYDYIVCEPMVAYQSDGWSDNKQSDEKYGYLLEGIELYKG